MPFKFNFMPFNFNFMPFNFIPFIKYIQCDYDNTEYSKNVGNSMTVKEFYNKFPNYKPYKLIYYKEKCGLFDICCKCRRIACKCNRLGNYRNDYCSFKLIDIKDLSSYDAPNEIAEVVLPESTLIEVERDHIIVDEFVITKIINKKDFINNHLQEINVHDFIHYIDNPSEDIQLAAVEKNGYAIKWINNPSEDIQLAAVKQDVYAIIWINNPSEDIQLAAVEKNGHVIRWIKNPSEDVQLAAVKHDGCAIRWIKNPSEDVQLAAVKHDGCAIRWIKNPSEDVQCAAVSQNSKSFQYIYNPSLYVRLLTLKINLKKL
jgi:hypothetical protein